MDLNEYLEITKTKQSRAAEQIGCKRSQMSRWCAGITRPNRYWWTRVTAWSRGAITADVPKREKETT